MISVKRVLIYNWIPFTDEKRGGGVRIYLKNLVDYILQNSIGVRITFLCSGVYCDEKDLSVRYERVGTYADGKCEIFAIINSPIFAPAWISFCRVDDMFNDRSVGEVFETFLNREGPFDVVHFHNMEGLSISALSTKSKFPDIKYIYTIHNYYPFCPEVNLWKEKDNICCREINTSGKCLSCMVTHVPAEKLRKKQSMAYELTRNETPEKRSHFEEIGRRLDQEYKEAEERPLQRGEIIKIQNSLDIYRKEMVKAINSNMDLIISVSERVKEIALNMGLDARKVRTMYIGTKAAERAISKAAPISKSGIISIIYMGYQRREKGFFFLIDALNSLKKEISSKIDLTIAALGNENDRRLWELDEKKFYSFRFQNGYQRAEQTRLLRGKHLGIVPVLWEDNLPQVAIEFAASGVPVLCSDLGGAHELCPDPRFVFPAGNKDEFCKRIAHFVDCPTELSDYYDTFTGLKTMEEHLTELSEAYQY